MKIIESTNHFAISAMLKRSVSRHIMLQNLHNRAIDIIFSFVTRRVKTECDLNQIALIFNQ